VYSKRGDTIKRKRETMEYDDIYDAMEPMHLPCSEPDDEPEPECECYFSGDQADASGCDLHSRRKPAALATTGAAWVLEQVMPLFNRRAR
jgi:hypothetical protein